MRSVLCFLSLIIVIASVGQTEIGPRIEAYPAGVISNLQVSIFSGEKSAWNIKAGYNLTDRKDFGEFDNEEGGGLGFGGDYRYYFKSGNKGFYAEAGVELWFMKIDWLSRSDDIAIPDITGQTDITVLQPTIGVGYQLRSQNNNWAATLGLTVGREVNIKTKGESVGQGGITIGTISITRRL